jgi:N-acetylneuraminate synthase
MELFKGLKKPLFISEISSNHNNDLSRCKELIDATKEAGCDGVKFQLFKIDKLFSSEALIHKPEIALRKKWELNEKIIPELSTYAKNLGLLFSCTPFYIDGVKILNPYIDFFKIASYELLWKELFVECANTGKPLVFSTGMSVEHEIKSALDSISNSPVKEIMMLHCNSSYPTPVGDVNLSVLDNLRNKFQNYLVEKKIYFGYSDHSVIDSVILNSIIRYNSKMIEFHIDLEGDGFEFESGHCWLPDQIKKVIDFLEEINLSNGKPEITPSNSELIEREWRADPLDGLRPLIKTRNIIK